MKRLLKRKVLILSLVFLLGFLIRALNIHSNPPSLYGDELTIAYDAYSILKTGRDSTGEFLPLTLTQGAGRPAGYVYGSLPFIAIFGPSAIGVRALSVLSGLGVIILIYLICKFLFKEEIGVLAAFLMAINPWAVSVSRGGFETNFALFLALLGTYFFLTASNRRWFYIFSAICFGLTIHTYPTYKVVMPLFLLLLVYLGNGGTKYQEKVDRKEFIIAAIVLSFFVVLAIFQTLTASSEARFLSINAFSQKELQSKIIQQINFDRTITSLPGIISPLFYNRYVEYGLLLFSAYLKNFSIDYLFFLGDWNPRHNMGSMGGLFLAEFILVISGIIILAKDNQRKLLFLLFWLALAPSATTLLLDTHNLRNLFMLPPLILLSAVGAYFYFSKFLNHKLVSIFLGMLILGQFILFIQRIYFLSPNKFSSFWAYPAKIASEHALEKAKYYDFVLIADRIDNVENAILVYGKVDPNLAISQYKNQSLIDGVRYKQFGNVLIGSFNLNNIRLVSQNLNGSVLYLGTASEISKLDRTEIYSVAYNKDKVEAFMELAIK